MKILVMHQVPYQKIRYHLAIDHDRHDIWYFGSTEKLAGLPDGLRCQRVEVAEGDGYVSRIIELTSPDDGFEQVLALSEYGILEAWRLREHLGIPGPSKELLERVRDKVRMKETLAGSGIRCPRFVAEPVPGDPLPWSGPTVLKPRRGASSEGVAIYDTADEALAAYRALGADADAELEEFVEGDLYHADGLIDGGIVTDLVASRYIATPLDFAQGRSIGSCQVPHDAGHLDFAQAVVGAIGIDAGCLHLEFFQTPRGERVFLEIANRLGGGGIVDAHLRRTGVSLPAHEIAIRLGWPRPQHEPVSGRYHGFAMVPGHHLRPGGAYAVEVPEAITRHECLDRLHTLDPGQPLPEHISYQEWLIPAFVEASHPDPDVLAEFLTECVNLITIREGIVA